LYWVAFQRLPLAIYNEDGHEFRETEEIGERWLHSPARRPVV